jgi:hypothetical protein
LALVGGRKRRAILPTPCGGRPSIQVEVLAEATTYGVVESSTDLAKVPCRRSPHESPKLCAQIGGFRHDPFSSFTIESTPYLASAYDYCKSTPSLLASGLNAIATYCSDATVYLPSAFRMANIRGDIPFFYSRIIHDTMQFDALIALVLTVQRMHLARKERMSLTIMHHVTRATSALREKLLSGQDITSDAVFCTMFRLLVVQVRKAFHLI